MIVNGIIAKKENVRPNNCRIYIKCVDSCPCDILHRTAKFAVLKYQTEWQTWLPFHWHGLTLILDYISNHTSINMLVEIIHQFPNFNRCTVEVWEWISNFIRRGVMDATFPCWN